MDAVVREPALRRAAAGRRHRPGLAHRHGRRPADGPAQRHLPQRVRRPACPPDRQAGSGGPRRRADRRLRLLRAALRDADPAAADTRPRRLQRARPRHRDGHHDPAARLVALRGRHARRAARVARGLLRARGDQDADQPAGGRPGGVLRHHRRVHPRGLAGHRRNDDRRHRRGAAAQADVESQGPHRDDDHVHRPGQHGRHATGDAGVPDDLRRRDAAVPRHLRSQPGQRLAARTLSRGIRVSESATVALAGQAAARGIRRRRAVDIVFQALALLVLVVTLGALAALIADVWSDGFSRLSWDFVTSFPSRRASQAGIWHALTGSVFVILLTALIAVPIGVAAAIYLEEYGSRSVTARLIEINITNLAAVPSVIYGLLGLGLIVRMLGLGRSVLAGAATLALLVLPVVILSTREALRAVPKSIREGSYALGATKWQTIWHQVLPMASPGILTGMILALSRAIGETAPLIAIGALTYVPFAPDSIWSPFTVLPIQIFNWVSRPQSDFKANAAAGILVLLVLLLTMNGLAIWLRDRYQKKVAG